MNAEEKLKERYGTDAGFVVPKDYFDTMRISVLDSLPEYPEKPIEHKLSAWQRLRPYIYLAAMFAGVWLMMKVFYNMSYNESVSLDNPPEAVALAMMESNDDDIYSGFSDSDEELMDDIATQYDNIDEFERDFDYQLKPEYDNLDLSSVIEKSYGG